MLGIPSPDPNGCWGLTRTLGGGVVPAATAPGRCCSFGIPGEEVGYTLENPQKPLSGLSRQATPRDGREARTGKQSPGLPPCLSGSPSGSTFLCDPAVSWVSA